MKKIKKKSSFFDKKPSLMIKSIAKPSYLKSIPKPHKLMVYIILVFCLWNFIYQILSIIHIYIDDYANNKQYIIWSIASVCLTVFFALALYFFYDNRKVLKKILRKYKINLKLFDYLLITGHLCFLISLSIIIFFNEKFENPRGNYGFMLSFSNVILLSAFVFLITKDFKIKFIFVAILFIFWSYIIFANDKQDIFYEIQTIKMVIRILCDISMLTIFLYYYNIRPIKMKNSSKLKIVPSFSSQNEIVKPERSIYNEENKIYDFLNQIHSAIIIFDEEMDLKFYNKEIYSFLLHSPNNINDQPPLMTLERVPMSMSKSEYSKIDIIQKLNDITNINLFDSDSFPIKDVIL